MIKSDIRKSEQITNKRNASVNFSWYLSVNSKIKVWEISTLNLKGLPNSSFDLFPQSLFGLVRNLLIFLTVYWDEERYAWSVLSLALSCDQNFKQLFHGRALDMRWLRLSQLISNKREWSNCFIKIFTNFFDSISLSQPDDVIYIVS